MKVIDTEIPEVKIIEPRVFEDARGFFLETYNRNTYREAGIDLEFVQDNHSHSGRGTLRGLHYQLVQPQAKLVWSITGTVFDVAVDVRPSSKTFKKWVGVELNAENKRRLYVPVGFAHGFCVLSETAEVMYKCTDFYNPSGEGGFIWNDPEVGIEWPIDDPILSDKDAKLPGIANARLFD